MNWIIQGNSIVAALHWTTRNLWLSLDQEKLTFALCVCASVATASSPSGSSGYTTLVSPEFSTSASESSAPPQLATPSLSARNSLCVCTHAGWLCVTWLARNAALGLTILESDWRRQETSTTHCWRLGSASALWDWTSTLSRNARCIYVLLCVCPCQCVDLRWCVCVCSFGGSSTMFPLGSPNSPTSCSSSSVVLAGSPWWSTSTKTHPASTRH